VKKDGELSVKNTTKIRLVGVLVFLVPSYFLIWPIISYKNFYNWLRYETDYDYYSGITVKDHGAGFAWIMSIVIIVLSIIGVTIGVLLFNKKSREKIFKSLGDKPIIKKFASKKEAQFCEKCGASKKEAQFCEKCGANFN